PTSGTGNASTPSSRSVGSSAVTACATRSASVLSGNRLPDVAGAAGGGGDDDAGDGARVAAAGFFFSSTPTVKPREAPRAHPPRAAAGGCVSLWRVAADAAVSAAAVTEASGVMDEMGLGAAVGACDCGATVAAAAAAAAPPITGICGADGTGSCSF